MFNSFPVAMSTRDWQNWKANAPGERRKKRAGNKYKKVDGEKWIIDTSKDHGSVRPIDLVSRDPDRLREFDSKEAAVAFEEERQSSYRFVPTVTSLRRKKVA